MGYVTKTLWKLTICAMLVATLGCSDSKEKQQKEQKEQTLQDSHNTRHNVAKPNIVILATSILLEASNKAITSALFKATSPYSSLPTIVAK